MLENLIYIAAVAVTLGIPGLYFLHARRKSRRAAVMLQKAAERGMDEPVSLHPFIDPNICIGAGACVKACPELNVLGLIDNCSKLINPSHCIGHGMCQAACPVDAITLVFGTEKRGVDIPSIKGNFETNVPGIFIAGELGGMGLIRNAVTQGKQVAEFIAKSLDKRSTDGVYDLAIVGAGPAGLAASLRARELGLNVVTLDQEDLGGTVLTYPRRKLVMTQPFELPGYGTVKAGEIQKERLLEIFQDVFQRTGLTVNGGEKAEDIRRVNGHFEVATGRNRYQTRRVLLSIGRRGSPRKLGVPGEKSGKLAYRLLDPEQFRNMKLLVVGGGDSAVEAALALADQPGNTVHLSYRQEAVFRIKEGNRVRFDAAVYKGQIQTIFNSQVLEIQPQSVRLTVGENEQTLSNDYIFVFIGGELPTQLLEKIGISFERKYGRA